VALKPLLTKSGLEGLDNAQDEGCAAWYFLEHLGHLVVAAPHQALTVDLLNVIANLSIYIYSIWDRLRNF
jgi:hypothetical protein